MINKIYKNGCLLSIIFLIITSFVSCGIIKKIIRYYDEENFKLAIPDEIRIDRTIALDYHFELGLPGDESCGGAVFKLSQSTLDLIEKEGLGFLSNNRWGRGTRTDDGYHGGRVYNSWKETIWQSESSLYKYYGQDSSLSCLNAINHKIIEKAKSKILLPGSYYTQDNRGRIYDLIIIPDLGIIVYSFYG